MWKVERARAVVDIDQDGETLRVSVTRDATAEERPIAIFMLVVACALFLALRYAPWQILAILFGAIAVLGFQVFFGTAIYRSSLVASRDGIRYQKDAGLFPRRQRSVPAQQIRNLLFGVDGLAGEPGLLAKRTGMPDVCVLPYVDEQQAVELRQRILEHMTITSENIVVSRPVSFR